MAETLHTLHTTILSYLRDLGKTLKYGRRLPHELSESNKLSNEPNRTFFEENCNS